MKNEITQEEFGEELESVIGGLSAAQILATPGAYEVFSEEYNNDVIARVEERKADEVESSDE